MRKKKYKAKEIKLFCPESFHDIEDIVEILQEKETTILVNLSKSTLKKEMIGKILKFISESQRSYMRINIKKIFPKVFVCWSEYNKI